MSQKQIYSCTERLAEVDRQAAKLFFDEMMEANKLHQKANVIRREMWEMYRAVLGIQKRGQP